MRWTILVAAVSLIGCGDDASPATDAAVATDAGRDDAGGEVDAGRDAGDEGDAGGDDAGSMDAGSVDAGSPDAAPVDGGPPDAGPPDGGAADAGPPCLTMNLLANGGFDTDVTPWVAAFPTRNMVTHDMLDVAGSATSGSLRSRTTRMLNQRDPTSTCLPVTAGTNVTFSARARIAPSATASGDVVVTINFYGMAGCGGPFLTTTSSTMMSAEDVWHMLDVMATAPTAPRPAVSMQVFFDVYRRSGSELTTNWDDACVLGS